MRDYFVIGHSETIGVPNVLVNRHTEREIAHDSGMNYDGDKIRLLRERKGWSMAELARRVSIKQPSLWALEHQVTKEPKAGTMIRIAAALGVPLRDLLKPAKKGKEGKEDALDDLTGVFDQLDARNKQALIAAARALLETQK